MSLVLQELTVKSSRLKKFNKKNRPANKNEMSIGFRCGQQSPQPAITASGFDPDLGTIPNCMYFRTHSRQTKK